MNWGNLTELTAPAPGPDRRPFQQTLEQRERADHHRASFATEEQEDLAEVAAPEPVEDRNESSAWSQEHNLEAAERQTPNGEYSSGNQAKPKSSSALTQVYIVSHLIFFSILGTLARLGVQWLTFYPGSPTTFSNIWANFGGTLVMGFFVEDRQIFMEEWGEEEANSYDSHNEKSKSSDSRGSPSIRAKHGKVKKTIPLFIGLTTGFCGSFTSFSTFMRDVFVALANDMPSPVNHPPLNTESTTTVPRNRGYSFLAVLAVLILTVTASIGALKLGAHIAIAADRFMPTLPFKKTRNILDPLVVFLGWGCWVGAIVMTAVPPDRPGGPQSHGASGQETWRGQVLFALVFAPLGCLLRFYLSAKLNSTVEGFPLGTFASNIFGTAVFGMSYDLQRAPLMLSGAAVAGGSLVGCQVLQGIEDGFCGCLTTVSTWAVELTTLKRKHGYVYGATSVLGGLALLVIIIGSVFWSIGLLDPVCVVEVS